MKMSIQKDVLEKLVLDYIDHMLEEESILDEIVLQIQKEQRQMIGDNTALKVLNKEYKQTETSINNILSAIENGGTTPSVMERLRKLESQKATLEEQIAIEKSKESALLTESEIRDFYGKALELSGKMLIGYLVKKIILFDDKIQIIFNSPLTYGSPDESLGFSIINKNSLRHYKVHYGYKAIQRAIVTELRVE